MVTSTKQPEKKVVKMAENSGTVVPQRTLLGEVNEQITCPLCHGYYIDATTIVECLHSFCRSCIIKHLQVKSYCPVCEMMINSAKPNIKLDKALQDIVYKLVPGLFQKEMERRQHFYSSRPGPAASATPEQRGEDTERIIFSPEDVISFSLEYTDVTDTDSISSKSSDSNETQSTSGARRYLQCPAIVNISHLKKFLSMKFDVDSTQFAIDILYKRVPLPDCYTLMDIAYIYNWKRNEPMRFFYQIIDYVAIRSRLFDSNGKRSHFQDRKASPTLAEDLVNSPALNMNDQASEASSGTDSPMPDENNVKKTADSKTNNLNITNQSKESQSSDVNDKSNNKKGSNTDNVMSLPNHNDEDVEKSQFLISFELTAKNNQPKPSPALSTTTATLEENQKVVDCGVKSHTNVDNNHLKVVDGSKSITNVHPKTDDSLKRKNILPTNVPEMKKVKIELEKTKLHLSTSTISASSVTRSVKTEDGLTKTKESETLYKTPVSAPIKSTLLSQPLLNKETKQQTSVAAKQLVSDISAIKRPICVPQNTSSPKRKTQQDLSSMQTSVSSQKTVSPLKIQLPKVDLQGVSLKTDSHKPAVKKIPDLKPSGQTPLNSQKTPPVNKVRMDLLANNSDPTIDRSKILSQVNSSLNAANMAQTSGDPLKSLFDSCKINIPSSLSITLTDQKQDQRNTNESITNDQNKSVTNKNLAGASNSAAHKAPSPPVHNYIEILKLPDTDPKKQQKTESVTDSKTNTPNKTDTNVPQSKPPSKPSETSAKGPVPNLKPISESKLAKQSANYGSPITFQQTFEQQLQSLQSDKKSKLHRNKGQVPKLVPATPKTLSAANKSSNSAPPKLPTPPATTSENKTSTALDLSTPHNVQSQLDPQQNKTFETMQSIANLAKKQNLPLKALPPAMSQNTYSGISNRPTPLRIPTNVSQMKYDKGSPSISQTASVRQEIPSKSNQIKQLTPSPSPTVPSLSYHNTLHNSSTTSTAQQSSRTQTRSPSSSPKLVIAEDKQSSGPSTDHNINQINQISSTQIPHINVPKSESLKVLPGPSKPGLKPVKPLTPSGKITGVRQPITPTVKSNNNNSGINNSADFLPQQQFLAQHAQQALLRQQFEMQWFKATHYDLFKNMTNMAHQAQSDLNNKDKQ